MVEFQPKQRALLADKLLDFANIAVGSTVLGQVLADRPFSVQLALLGLGGWGALFVCSVALAGRSTR